MNSSTMIKGQFYKMPNGKMFLYLGKPENNFDNYINVFIMGAETTSLLLDAEIYRTV